MIMARFSFFGDQEHRVFDYKPMYYDKQQEEIKKKFAAVDGSMDKKGEEGKEYVPGSYIRGSIRDGAYRRSRSGSTRAQSIIGIVGLLLVMAVLIYIAKFYMML